MLLLLLVAVSVASPVSRTLAVSGNWSVSVTDLASVVVVDSASIAVFDRSLLLLDSASGKVLANLTTPNFPVENVRNIEGVRLFIYEGQAVLAGLYGSQWRWQAFALPTGAPGPLLSLPASSSSPVLLSQQFAFDSRRGLLFNANTSTSLSTYVLSSAQLFVPSFSATLPAPVSGPVYWTDAQGDLVYVAKAPSLLEVPILFLSFFLPSPSPSLSRQGYLVRVSGVNGSVTLSSDSFSSLGVEGYVETSVAYFVNSLVQLEIVTKASGAVQSLQLADDDNLLSIHALSSFNHSTALVAYGVIPQKKKKKRKQDSKVRELSPQPGCFALDSLGQVQWSVPVALPNQDTELLVVGSDVYLFSGNLLLDASSGKTVGSLDNYTASHLQYHQIATTNTLVGVAFDVDAGWAVTSVPQH